MDVSVGYRHVLRRQWSNLIRDLPEASDLLSNPVLAPLFTLYEKEEICGSYVVPPRDQRSLSKPSSAKERMSIELL